MSDVTAILLIACPDQSGLVAAVTAFIYQNSGNIVHLDQHVDEQAGVFFMRVEWTLASFAIERGAIEAAFAPIAEQYRMDAQFHTSDERIRMVLFVSRQAHALYDLLARWRIGEFNVDIPLIISNHETLRPVAQQFDVEFVHTPVTRDSKTQVEQQQLALLREVDADLIRTGALYADRDVSVHRAIPEPHHQYPPQFSAGIYRCASVPSGVCARRQDYRAPPATM